MNNVISYYYGINILDVYDLGDKYYFNYDNKNYYLLPFNRDYNDIKSIIDLCLELRKRNVLTNEIIINKFNMYLTPINKKYYILLKENSNDNIITMNDIFYIQNNTLDIIGSKNLYRTDYISMWSSKIDYYEDKIKDIQGKYKNIDKTIDYYIGLGENALVYLINNNIKISNVVVSHRRININKGGLDFYNPVNYILDSRTRDFSEYIKDLFFNGELSFDTFINYLEYMRFDRDEYILFISRMLFPSYYFDIVDRIIDNNEDDNLLEGMINKKDDYIIFIRDIFNYLMRVKRINIPYIEWIIKKI